MFKLVGPSELPPCLFAAGMPARSRRCEARRQAGASSKQVPGPVVFVTSAPFLIGPLGAQWLPWGLQGPSITGAQSALRPLEPRFLGAPSANGSWSLAPWDKGTTGPKGLRSLGPQEPGPSEPEPTVPKGQGVRKQAPPHSLQGRPGGQFSC